MTTTQHTPVDARTVTLEHLAVLEAGTMVLWNGLTATHGVLWSPIRQEAAPDYAVFADDVDPRVVQVMHYGSLGFLVENPFPLTPTTDTVAGILDAIGGRSGRVCRFATGMELNHTGRDLVPSIAVWTAPVVDAVSSSKPGAPLTVRVW